MFLTRLFTAVLVLALFLAALFLLPPLAWTVCLLPALLLAAHEWAALAGYSGVAAWSYAGFATAAGAALTLMRADPVEPASVHLAIYIVAAAFWLLVAPVWLKAHWRVRGFPLAAAGLIVLIPSWTALVQLQSAGGVLLAFLGVVWIADTAAYLAGRQFGRHKLAPGISPGKTWEGVAGAAAAVGVYYLVLTVALDGAHAALSGGAGALAFAVLLVLSIEGDLFESWIKRQAGVKDSGRLLPGHGGVLDRIDGLTATLPAVALVLHYVR